jgi:hypothetical protein
VCSSAVGTGANVQFGSAPDSGPNDPSASPTPQRTGRDSVGIDRAAEPERRLMAAVLQGAVDDMRGGSSHRRGANGPTPSGRVLHSAVAYVTSRDRRWPFSFENLCEALDLEPRRLRRELRKAPVPEIARVAAHDMPNAGGVLE